MIDCNWYSPRGLELVYHSDQPDHDTLTVENYSKWYELFLVRTDGEVVAYHFGYLSDICGYDTPYVDHVPNPVVVARLAKLRGWRLDEQSYEMIIGRWELESTDHSKYRLED